MATDVTVKGAGVFGLSIAWECVRRGARVLVIDPGGPGAGASGGVLGALSPHTPDPWNHKKAFQLDSLLAAPTFWETVEKASGLSTGYGRIGRLQPVPEGGLDLARKRATAAWANWRGLAEWRVIPSGKAAFAPPSPSGWLIHDTLSARIDPARACAALAAALSIAGAEITATGPSEGAVVWATGVAGLADLSRVLGKTVGGAVKGQAALLAHAAGDVPHIFAEGMHIVPHDNGTVAVGSTSERSFDDATGTDQALDALIQRARLLVPALSDAPVIRRWAGVRPRARTRAPMLGPWPGRPGHFVANGGFKIGLGLAPGVAAMMADLVLDTVDRIPDDFRVEASL